MRDIGTYINMVCYFSLRECMKYLAKAEDGTIYVDKEKMAHNHERRRLFYGALTSIYNSGWKDVLNLTIYVDIVDGDVVAGAYNLVTGEKRITRRVSKSKLWVFQQYEEQDVEGFKKQIVSAQNAP